LIFDLNLVFNYLNQTDLYFTYQPNSSGKTLSHGIKPQRIPQSPKLYYIIQLYELFKQDFVHCIDSDEENKGKEHKKDHHGVPEKQQTNRECDICSALKIHHVCCHLKIFKVLTLGQ